MNSSKYKWDYTNLIIPVGGIGERFSSAGYKIPKPLIEIEGQTQLEISLQSILSSHLFEKVTIACRSGLVTEIKKILCDRPTDFLSEITLIDVGASTRGAADTINRAISHLQLVEESIWIVDSDTFLKFASFPFVPESCWVAVGTTTASSESYSYVALNNQKEIVRIAEKKVISNNAVCGMYGFINANFFQICFDSLQEDANQKEIYLSSVVSKALESTKGFPIPSTNWIPLGTPEEISNLTLEQKTQIRSIF